MRAESASDRLSRGIAVENRSRSARRRLPLFALSVSDL
jgi:hypothetical protein